MLDKSKLDVDKIVKNSLDNCDLYVIQKGDKIFLLYMFDKDDYVYFKIMPEIIGKWENCDNIYYSAIGLFGFVKKSDNIESKIKEKIEVLESLGLT